MTTQARTFEDKPATRERTPLMLGIVGPSGTGKTYSALRLATGIQRVSGGDIHVIDTEAKRALHYADEFTFRHTPFAAPFDPLSYLAAIEHCRRKGAGVVIVDSTSHSHEGAGGVLEMHEAEVQRLSRGDSSRADKVKMLAWAKPKAEHREMLNTILQMPINFIFCFRAKEKLKIVPGKEPQQLGWMAIAAEEFIYEMTANILLLPGSNGVPCWQSGYPGEQATMKLPRQFRELFAKPVQLSEDIGQRLAEWAAGKPAASSTTEPSAEGAVILSAKTLAERFKDCRTRAEFAVIEEAVRGAWKRMSTEGRKAVTAERDLARQAIAEAEKTVSQAADPSTSEPPADLFKNETGAAAH